MLGEACLLKMLTCYRHSFYFGSLSVCLKVPNFVLEYIDSESSQNWQCTLSSAVDNHFICSLLDMDFCTVQKKKKKKKKKKRKKNNKTKKKSRSNMYFLIGVPNTEYTRCPAGWGWVRQRCRVSYVTGRPTDICLQLGKACYPCRR